MEFKPRWWEAMWLVSKHIRPHGYQGLSHQCVGLKESNTNDSVRQRHLKRGQYFLCPERGLLSLRYLCLTLSVVFDSFSHNWFLINCLFKSISTSETDNNARAYEYINKSDLVFIMPSATVKSSTKWKKKTVENKMEKFKIGETVSSLVWRCMRTVKVNEEQIIVGNSSCTCLNQGKTRKSRTRKTEDFYVPGVRN